MRRRLRLLLSSKDVARRQPSLSNEDAGLAELAMLTEPRAAGMHTLPQLLRELRLCTDLPNHRAASGAAGPSQSDPPGSPASPGPAAPGLPGLLPARTHAHSPF